MTISTKMTEEEKNLAEAYAKKNGLSLSEAMKRAFFEKVEDECDIALGDMALREYEKDPKTISYDEVKRSLDSKVRLNASARLHAYVSLRARKGKVGNNAVT